ncbi:DUF423 domain-containing protein [Tenacibaculum maritimum]|uniref:DUF423 domain-containing protein n=2 Tax=Tenacibaculum maritimum TaxID=107401 RepID=UPI0012E6DD77|nr:DUF423 domain-containing protein [Tenacibaculum maritimum]MCD9566452.1 DUF423 domain-containing protein [Tenacibaculum maritimum]MCD9597227.1 DUF423 domain-containing protein [Tenacibaculum maritimum]MCD9611434.1 DUF423 domain-containing protein [Tenacibaculum maritimum]MCD9614343.1 DUF423 domain-containing protein [Tenacibaculum maritimum]MCD9621460.1 DUF423 domain-containing protein [Tenacibaculum maritimum]
MTSKMILISAAIFGMLAVIFGAFGAHALKKVLSETQLKSFETGVKYQMYHALVLLFIGNQFSEPNQTMACCFIIGIFLFSFSIYGLILSDYKGKKITLLGPVTPLGGGLLILGWATLIWEFIQGV